MSKDFEPGFFAVIPIEVCLKAIQLGPEWKLKIADSADRTRFLWICCNEQKVPQTPSRGKLRLV